ncbi:MAG: hypothetical protein ACXVDC_14540, partial [Bacteroidia bacterium]
MPNGDFEAIDGLSDALSNIKYPAGCPQGNFYMTSSTPSWTAPTCGTPDYYSTTYTAMGVPTNPFASSTSAHSGGGYAGLYIYDAGYDRREYIQSALKCPLITGLTYSVSYWVSLSSVSPYNTPSNNISAYLSSTAPTSSSTLALNYTPQITTNTAINNSGSWTKVVGTMVGAGEQYITVGNFLDDAHTSPYPSSNTSYYFIDDINVVPATPTLTAGSCQNGSVTITASGVPNSTVTTWAGPSSYTATGSAITVASPSVATTYTCTINMVGTCGCANVTQT